MQTDARAKDGASARRLTPMLRQYLDAKAEAPPESVLLFRMGDFYELFFEDAVVVAQALDLQLTSRDKDGDDPIPMAGVPHHAITSYLTRLTEKGFTVAICDQLEDPKQAKGIVRRGITRIVTPATTTDLEALDPASNCYLASCLPAGPGESGGWHVALLDLLAGEVLTTRAGSTALADELQRMGVREVITAGAHVEALRALARGARFVVHAFEGEPLASDEACSYLRQRFDEAALGAWSGVGDPGLCVALAEVLRFAERTQRRQLVHLMPPRAYSAAESVVLDESTRRNLELTATQLDAERKGSLLWHLDRCKTVMGSRALRQWMLFPLRDREAIAARQDQVEELRDDRALREALQAELAHVRDIERLAGRVAVGRASPRDLGQLRASLARVAALKGAFADRTSALGATWRHLDVAPGLARELDLALVDEPPTSSLEGNIFRRGYRADLDELIALSTEGHDFLAELEQRERARTGIPSLKVRYNRVFGYYLEVTKANLAMVPSDYVRKQTLVGAERYITPELKTYEDRVLTADERRKARELELFGELVAKVGIELERLRAISRAISTTDVLASLAQVAEEGRYVRPELVDEPVLELVESRHPVLERLLPGGERFVPNDVVVGVGERQMLIVTGPNMAGKSTVMRQVALAALLAHMGAFVPAKRARIGMCDRIFTRVGASDAIGRGHSTFMVEMVETATILREATRASLVLLDEIGRGTATFDGLSLAWAVAEHLHDHIGCRAMFATHFHELTELALERPRIVNVSVAAEERAGGIVFLRRLVEGAANRSYGIEVARLAGLPQPVLARAKGILENLERDALDAEGHPTLAREQGPTRAVASERAPAAASRVLETLRGLEVQRLTPIEALVRLDELQRLLAAESRRS